MHVIYCIQSETLKCVRESKDYFMQHIAHWHSQWIYFFYCWYLKVKHISPYGVQSKNYAQLAVRRADAVILKNLGSSSSVSQMSHSCFVRAISQSSWPNSFRQFDSFKWNGKAMPMDIIDSTAIYLQSDSFHRWTYWRFLNWPLIPWFHAP